MRYKLKILVSVMYAAIFLLFVSSGALRSHASDLPLELTISGPAEQAELNIEGARENIPN